ncbi:hypothetical protein JCM5353_007532 [Sporobolomyces roseus]
MSSYVTPYTNTNTPGITTNVTEMVFLEELSNQERAQKEQREREIQRQQYAEASGSGSASDHHRSRGGGGGGATFLSDEETNASDAGSAFDSSVRPPPHLETSVPPLSTAKGKGKAVEASPPYDPTPSTTTSATKKKPVKSKKQTIGADGKPVAREKKKKAGRACAACQKAHLTCDDGRPCARCIKKGCPDDCVDGARKKAKYLQEVPDELLDRNRHPQGEGTPSFGNGVQLLDSPSAAAKPSQSPNPPHSTLPSSSQAPAPTPSTSQPIFDFSTAASTSLAPPVNSSNPSYYDPSSFLNFATTPSASLDHTHFGSEAANLEYAILSSMLNGNGFALDAHTPNLSGGIGASSYFNAHTGRAPIGEETLLGSGQNATKDENGHTNEGFGAFGQEGSRQQDTEMFSANEEAGGEENSVNRGVQASGSGGGSGVPGLMTAEEALRSVTKPYPYAQSYHFLVKHLKTRFEKNDILRIVRALATFRPSLIALQMPLTEEDETFVERTFQRTLVELNKLISFSGTPTVVWRRTGEICLVGTEFCLLTGWKREELVGTGNVNGVTTSGGGRAGGGKYIFELFDTASVVEYYESFAKHAFESTSTSVTLQCVVLGPDGRPVPCAFCFSVRRDLFSCPFLIIGSFLPILV